LRLGRGESELRRDHRGGRMSLANHCFKMGTLTWRLQKVRSWDLESARLHGDPFDRILIAQSAVEGITLLTSDEKVAQYPGPIRKL
jgi:PIN domain nuclease of toxin-antitoxin system